MKRAVILHGTDGKPEHNWFPWLKSLLESNGYEVWVPELPNNHFPNRAVYNEFLLTSKWNFKDNLIIGHSSGAVSVLNLLEDARCPSIKMGFLVGAWAHMSETDLDTEQFKDLFPPDGFSFEVIKSKCNQLVFLHGDDDPFCPLEQAKWLADRTESKLVIVPGGHHLGSKFTELLQLEGLLNDHDLL